MRIGLFALALLTIGCDAVQLKSQGPGRFSEAQWDDTDHDRDGRTGPYVADGVSQTWKIEQRERSPVDPSTHP